MAAKEPVTLAVDIGGTGLKVLLLSPEGQPLTERLRVPTPDPPTPARLLNALDHLRQQLGGGFDRVSVGYPGVVKQGVTLSAANLHPKCIGFPLQAELEKLWRKPVRVANDAAVQGYAAIRGKGVELVITLGTGFGSALFINGHLVPGLELAHHPWRKDKTYEDYLGREGFHHLGVKRWNKRLAKAIHQIEALFNYDHLFIGGGNADKIDFSLPRHVTRIPNEDGLLGAAALWRLEGIQQPPKGSK